MPLKKKIKAKTPAVKEKKETPREKYFCAVGRRKAGIVLAKLYFSEKAGEIEITVNGRKMRDYFPGFALQNTILAPLKSAGSAGKFKVEISARGGGLKEQAEAARLAISRALVKFNGDLKKSLRNLGFLTRDARVVERKKAGLKKARRAPQWQKR